ncbi:MAG: dockerin type I domain-containing protein [Clostridia bacterium]|nr:dockerin type I domain-containing protein [Clostridia bacterium]
MKKLFSFILAFCVAFCFLCIPAFSASDMKLTDEVYPTVIEIGKPFSVYGIITSSCNILTVQISVTDSSGNTAFSYTGKPGEKTYNIHNVDYLMTFSKLAVGDYTYKIVASDTQQSNVVLLSKKFKVVSEISASSLKLTSANYPTSIVKGSTFSIYGTVSSDCNITELTCAVYSSNGTLQFIRTVYPDATSYSLSDVDKYMTFSKLDVGTYTYKITASDTQSKGVVLMSKEFRVVSSSGESIMLTNGNYPTVLQEGKTFSINGIVSSDYTISSVTIGVYTTGGTAKFEYTAKPGEKSYNIHNVDYLMTFSKLPVGTYVYKIVASDTNSKNVVLLQKQFTVIASESAEDGLKPVKWDVIDLSYHNTIISWDDIARSVDGVILRVGYRATGGSRSIGADVQFANFYKEASARGLHIGCYFFSNALNTDEAEAEADYVLKKLKENNCKLDMPVYFDMETDAQVALSASACTTIARAFCNKLAANGYYVGIYCNKYFARDEINASQLSDITFWIAQYARTCDYTGPYGMWQYSETGSTNGIKGNVDMNYCYYDYPAYIKANGYNGYKITPATPTYKIKTIGGLKLNEASKTVSAVPAGLDTTAFIKSYLEYSSNVSVVFANTVGGKIATGTTLTFKNGDKVMATYTVSVKGDIDGNSVVNSSDALLALQCSTGSRTLSGAKKISADINADGTINSTDALLILQTAVQAGK